jgi:hypothetical protein
LLVRESYEMSVAAKARDDDRERDLSWFDHTWVTDISTDGQLVALSETGGAAGAEFGVYVRGIDGTRGMRIGSGISQTISPDKRYVLSLAPGFDRLVAIPTGTGEPRDIARGMFHGAAWLDDHRVFVCGVDERAGCRIVDVARGTRTAQTTAGYVQMGWFQPSPDGATVAAQSLTDERIYLANVADGTWRALRGSQPGDRPIRWTSDGAALFVARFGAEPVIAFKVDVDSGARTEWRRFVPGDPSGVLQLTTVVATPDALAYAYSYQRRLATLYVAEGLR